MHGLLLRPVQSFVSEIYGRATWDALADAVGLDGRKIEPMESYPDALAGQLTAAASEQLGKPANELLEDVGVFLISHPKCETVRRLMRFGGDTFLEFLFSLNELPARAQLAVSGLTLPELDLREHFSGALTLTVIGGPQGAGDVLVGMLRALADDYGALVLLENLGTSGETTVIDIHIHDLSYQEGRSFQLAMGLPND